MATSDVNPETFLDNLREGHPRLIMTDERFDNLKTQAKTDTTLQDYIAQVIVQADEIAEKPPLKYDIPDGLRLLGVSRDCVDRVYKLGVAWRRTGESKYLEKGIDAIVRASQFKDWNPVHFLDTAELAHAVGLGYDWFYHELTDDQRVIIKSGLIKNGLQVGIDAYEGTAGYDPQRGRAYGWWEDCDHNWNQVCNSGLIIGALAVANTDPEYAQFIIPVAVASLPKALKMYGPDGAWAEGPGYWGYATRYTAYGFTALRTALDTDFGLLDIDGVSEAGFAPIHTTGPTGLYFNYADSGERNARRPMFQVFWLADIFKSDFMAANEHDLIAKKKATAQHVVWYVPREASAGDDRPLDKHFRGPVEVALMRSAWDDAEALFVGVKAGYNQANHGHLDLGSFEMDALGVRWVRDLGCDQYNLPNYWEKERDGRRWNYWRLGTLSHNVITIDGNNQDAEGTSNMTRFATEIEDAFAVIDLTQAYADDAPSVTRGVKMIDNRRSVLIQDEIELSEYKTITWGITTEAQIELKSDTEARLMMDGKALMVRVLTDGATLTCSDAPQPEPPHYSNEGVRRLEATVKATGDVTIAVLLAPEWSDGSSSSPIVAPISVW
ncbi:MAG: hypothetical protein HN521_22945 [Candidatus Latescibacteria bacterium]|nr:hypothetical protein [Candidatus Latescibacterota bacterium]